MEYINGSILFHRLLHIYKCSKQELIEILIQHVVIFDLAGRFLDIYIVWRVSQDKICFPSIHQPFVGFRQNGITADDTVLSKQPYISCLCHVWLCKLRFHIEIIFRDLLIMHGIKKLFDLRRFKTRDADIKI